MKKTDKQITTVSPSKVGKITKCPYQFHLDYKFGSGYEKAFNRNTFLGIVIHKVIQNYVEDPKKFDFDKDWNNSWHQKAAEYNLDTTDSDINEFAKYHVPYYYPNKLKTRKLIESLNLNFDKEIEAEKSIRGELITGEIDLFEKDLEGNITITDFKSGNIYNYSGKHKKAVKEDHILQLKTYGLYYYMKGVKAEKISTVLQGLDLESKASFKFSANDYENHKIWIINKLSELNRIGEKSHLAKPKEETCRFCNHKKICSSLHQDILDDPLGWKTTTVLTEINVSFINDNNSIDVLVNDRKVSILNIPDDVYADIQDKHSKGDKILIDQLFPRKMTSIRKWTRITNYSIIE